MAAARKTAARDVVQLAATEQPVTADPSATGEATVEQPAAEAPARVWAPRPKAKYCAVPNCGTRPRGNGYCDVHRRRAGGGRS